MSKTEPDPTTGEPDVETAPRWTLRPMEAAQRQPRWPPTAAEYEKKTEMEEAWKRQQDDPRPNVGFSCGGRYLTDPAGDGYRATCRYECVRCGLAKVLAVSSPADRRRQIKFACPACRKQTFHNPSAAKPITLIPFGWEKPWGVRNTDDMQPE